jgi:hypothetical protein
MDTTASSFTARNNAKRAAEKMIANGKAPAVDYGIRPRDDGRFEIVWKTVPTTGGVETEITAATTAAEDSTNPLLSVNEDPSDAPPNAGAEEAAAATGHEPAASSVPASGAPERDNKWPDGTRVMVRNKPRSWSEATIYTRLDAEYWRVQYLREAERRRTAVPGPLTGALPGPNDYSDLAFQTHGSTPRNRCSRMPLWCLPSQVSLGVPHRGRSSDPS